MEKSLRNKKRLFQEGIVFGGFSNLIDAYMKKPGKASCLSEVNEDLMRMFSHIAQDNSDNISKKYRLSITRYSDNKLYVDISDEKNSKISY